MAPDLTDADVLALEAGPYLDALVARHVFGMAVDAVDVVRPDGTPCTRWFPAAGGILEPYSFAHSAAWLVIEHYRDDPAYDWVVNFAVGTCEDAATGARRYIVDFDGGNSPGRATGETLPLAICRAALGLELWRQRRADA